LRARAFPARTRGSPPVFLVTGCSSGIGLALAHRLAAAAARGECRALLTARRNSLPALEQALDRAAAEAVALPLDVTLDHERRAAVAEAQKRWGGVDVLINNAGVAFRAAIEDMTEADERTQQSVNYSGPMALTRLVLPGMRARRWGRIVNVSSVSGMMAMPTMGSYTASKWALEGASEALWYEMRPWGVCVTLVQPGFIRSESFARVLRPEGLDPQSGPYAEYYRRMAPFIASLMRRSRATPDDVARKILAVAVRRRPPLRVSATADARTFHLLRRLLPRALYHAALYRLLPGISAWVPPEAQSPKGDEAAAR
jgi:NAD(P)-dependent dehydrogenase (short-subunit alcohol dehydrogenase family)